MKDTHLAKHPEIEVPNLHVMKALLSLKSRGYVTEQFAWRHFYWYRTNEGIQYLRDYLQLPSEIVPATLRRPARQEVVRPRMARPTGDIRQPDDRSGYRRAAAGPGMPDKKGDVGVGAGSVEFAGPRVGF